jgi:hypothetical protein
MARTRRTDSKKSSSADRALQRIEPREAVQIQASAALPVERQPVEHLLSGHVLDEFGVLLGPDQDFSDLCKAHLEGKLDIRTLIAHRELQTRFMNDAERDRLERAMHDRGVPSDLRDKIKVLLVHSDRSDFEIYLDTVFSNVRRITALTHLLTQCGRSDALRESFQKFRPAVDSATSNKITEDILQVTSDLLNSAITRPADLTELVRVGAGWLRDVVKKRQTNEAYVRAVKEAALCQLNPDNISSGGLTLKEIQRICQRIGKSLEMSHEKRMAIYDVVRHLLKAESQSSTFYVSLTNCRLEAYARVQARMMEQRLKLNEICEI